MAAPPEEVVEVFNIIQQCCFFLFTFSADLIIQVAYYSGAENPVTYSRIFKNTFACIFDLKKYPFDTQVDWQSPSVKSQLKQSFEKIETEQQIFYRFARSNWTHQKM